MSKSVVKKDLGQALIQILKKTQNFGKIILHLTAFLTSAFFLFYI